MLELCIGESLVDVRVEHLIDALLKLLVSLLLQDLHVVDDLVRQERFETVLERKHGRVGQLFRLFQNFCPFKVVLGAGLPVLAMELLLLLGQVVLLGVFDDCLNLVGVHVVEFRLRKGLHEILRGAARLLLVLIVQGLTFIAHLLQRTNQCLSIDCHRIVRVHFNVVDELLLLLEATLFQPLYLLPLLFFGKTGNVPAVLLSEPQEWRLISLHFLVAEVLRMPLFEDSVSVRFVIADQLFVEAAVAGLLPVEDLHDLRLVHEDVGEV